MIADASVVSAWVGVDEVHGEWARDVLKASRLAAPHLLPVEVAHYLRRCVLRRVLSAQDADVAMGDLLQLRVDLHPFEPFAARVWELRDTLTAYDAWYVALAEAFDVPLATLDRRLATAPGPTCQFVVPDDTSSGSLEA